MAGHDREASVAHRAQSFRGAPLLFVIVGEDREAVVVQAGGEVGDIGSEHEITDANRLVPGRVPGGEQELDASVTEQIAVAIDQHHLAGLAGIVARQKGVAPNGRIVVGGVPLGALDHDGHGCRDETQAADVIPVHVREHDLRERPHVDLLGDAPLLLEHEHREDVRPLVIRSRIGDRGWVQAGVDQNPLGRRLDHVGGHGKANHSIHLLAPAQNPGRRCEPADVEHVYLHDLLPARW